jgi:hypothetical protein
MNLRWTIGRLALYSYGRYFDLTKLGSVQNCPFFGDKIGDSYDPHYDHTNLTISGIPLL